MKEHSGKTMTVNIFEAPVAEYKTKRAAERFAKRLVRGGIVKPSQHSAFDMHWPPGKISYQVFEQDEQK